MKPRKDFSFLDALVLALLVNALFFGCAFLFFIELPLLIWGPR